MSSVRLMGVSKRFGTTQAVHPTDLAVADGEFLSILGPSGSGKTTILRIIAGFTQPDGGRIEIGGREVSRLPPHRRHLGVVFQSYALFPHMNVLDNVAFGLRMRAVAAGRRREKSAEALGLVGLDGFETRYPAQLSGGQQQRVALARAMVIDPDVLLLDEPLGALDLKLRKRMQIELKQLHLKLGRTFIYVTHDQEEALTMSDRVAVMDAGRLLQVDTPASIYDRPDSPFVAQFLGDSNLIPGHLSRTPDGDAVFSGPGGMRVAVPEEDANPAERVVLSIRPERVSVLPAGTADAGRACVQGVVEAVVFRGAWKSVVARLADEVRLEALMPNDARGVQLAQPGATVLLAFDPAYARILAEP